MLYPALVCWGISLLILVPAVNSYIVKRKKLSVKSLLMIMGFCFIMRKMKLQIKFFMQSFRFQTKILMYIQ